MVGRVEHCDPATCHKSWLTLTGSWPGPTIMSGMVIRRIVTAILAEVLLGDIVKTGLMAVTIFFFFFIFWAAGRGTGRGFVVAGVADPLLEGTPPPPNGE